MVGARQPVAGTSGPWMGASAARGRNRGTRWEHRNPIGASEPDKDRRRHAAYLVGAQAES